MEPILKDARVQRFDGKYPIQLDIPPYSTLADEDIRRVADLATWSTDPNKASVGYEGARSIILERQSAVSLDGVSFSALQVSGIGSRSIKFQGRLAEIDDSAPFTPPHAGNFMVGMPPGLMSSTVARKGRLYNTRPRYRATGTYTGEELREKVVNTDTAMNLPLSETIIPPVEAYGRYLDPKLSNDEGPFGFVVFSLPSAKKSRAAEEMQKELGRVDPHNPMEIMRYFYAAGKYMVPLVRSLRELHDSGYVHRQPHFSNFYRAEDMTILMDLATLHPLADDTQTNAMNRSIDLKIAQDNYDKLFRKTFRDIPEDFQKAQAWKVLELLMEQYSGKPDAEIDFNLLMKRTRSVVGKKAEEYDVVVEWVKSQGFTP